MRAGFPTFTALASLLLLTSIALQAQTAPPTGLALEVDPKGGPPVHQSIPGKFFGGHYRRLPSWKDDGSPQPQTFGLAYAIEGDGIRVLAFAFMDKFHDREILIGSYLLRETDKVAIDGMTKFGYEPMEVRIVKVDTAFPPSPKTSSRAASLTIIGVEPKVSNFPSYKITILNGSPKDVMYLEIRNYNIDRKPTIQAPKNKVNEVLIKAGQTLECLVKNGSPGTISPPNDLTPAAPLSIEIVSAVFSDKTFEGDLHSAAKFLALMLGQRLQLERALALLQSDNGPVTNLQTRVAQLDREAPPGAVEDLASRCPGVIQGEYPTLKAYLEAGLNQVKKELSKDIEDYSSGPQNPKGKSFDVWVRELKQKYEAWLASL
jgi:hypothetical protein